MKLSKYQLSFYRNTTQVGLDKLKFDQHTVKHVEEAIQSIIDQIDITMRTRRMKLDNYPESEIPYSVFPSVVKSMMVYNKKESQTNRALMLYYEHQVIGIIRENLPETSAICPFCGEKVALIAEQQDELTRWQKWLKRLFRHAFTRLHERMIPTCPVHGKVEPEFQTI